MCCVLSHFSLVWLFVTLWTEACQALPFLNFVCSFHPYYKVIRQLIFSVYTHSNFFSIFSLWHLFFFWGKYTLPNTQRDARYYDWQSHQNHMNSEVWRRIQLVWGTLFTCLNAVMLEICSTLLFLRWHISLESPLV